MTTNEQLVSQLVLTDRFLNSSQYIGVGWGRVLKLIACEKPAWSPLILIKDITAYSAFIPLVGEIPSGRIEIPLHVVVGKIWRAMPSVKTFPYQHGEDEEQRHARARDQRLLDQLYKMVVVEDQELRGVYTHVPEIQALFSEVDARHTIQQKVASAKGIDRTIAALELYLRGK